MFVYNLPDYFSTYPYVVVTQDGDDFWFYGAYSSFAAAMNVALEIDGYVYDSCIVHKREE